MKEREKDDDDNLCRATDQSFIRLLRNAAHSLLTGRLSNKTIKNTSSASSDGFSITIVEQ